AAQACDPRPAVEFCARAGARALSLFAYEEAVRQYRRALAALDLAGQDDGVRCRVFLRLGEALRHAGDEAEARATFLRASDLARKIDDAELLGSAALGFAGFWNASP